MKLRLIIFSSLIQLITLFKLGFTYNVFTFTQEAAQMKEKSHALHYKSDFYDFISRTFRLSNGQNVQCKIPIFSSINQNFLPTLEEEFQSAERNTTLVLTDQENMRFPADEADYILQSLQNQCAEYRTTTFLWQFCYKKYLRQFDDIHTIREAQKKAEEDIYAGYYPDYLQKTNLTKKDYNQDLNRYNFYQIDNHMNEKYIDYANKIYTVNPHISKPNLTEVKNIFISGKVISLQGFNTTYITQQNKGYLDIFTKKPIPQSFLSKQLQKIDMEKYELNTISAKYKYRLIFHTVINKQFILGKTELPKDIQIETFQVLMEVGQGKFSNPDFLKLYDGKYVYGKKLNALKNLNKNDLIIVQLYNQVLIKKIKKVWNHQLVELYVDSQGFNLQDKDLFIKSIQIFSRYRLYKEIKKGDLQNQFFGNYDNYFEFTQFKKEKYISGKYLLGFQYLNAEIGETLLFVDNKSFITARIVRSNKSVIEIDQDLHNFNGFIVKANSNKLKQSYYDYYPENINTIENEIKMYDSNDRNNTKNTIQQQKRIYYPKVLSFKNINYENAGDQNLLHFTDIENFSFSQEQLKKQRFLNFVISSPQTREDFQQLKLMITDSQEQINEAVKVNFTNDNQIFAYDVFNMKNIVSKNKRYENSTLVSNTTIWILIDTDNSIRLGFSSVISPSTQVLCLHTNYTNLRYFRFLTQHTVNSVLLFPYVDVIDKPIDFSVLSPNIQTFYQYAQQEYVSGEVCSAINGTRSFTAEFVCGESYFSILSVTEPSVCKYNVQVETYLLCQKQAQTYNIPQPPKNIYCVLKDKNNT